MDEYKSSVNPAYRFIEGIADSSEEIFFIKDTDYRYVSVSKKFAEFAGKNEPSEFTGKTDFDIFGNSELAKYYRKKDELLFKNGQNVKKCIEPMKSDSEKIHYAQMAKYLIRDKDGEIIGFYAHGVEITNEITGINGTSAGLSGIFNLPEDAFAVIVFDVDDWDVSFCKTHYEGNEVSENVYSMDEFVDRSVACIVSDNGVKNYYRSISPQKFRNLFNTGKKTFSMQYLRKNSNGKEIWVKEITQLVEDNDHLLAIISLYDIDDEKKAYNEIRRAGQKENILALLDQNEVVGIACVEICDEKLKLYYVNETALSWIDYDRKDMEYCFSTSKYTFVDNSDIDEIKKLAAKVRTLHTHETVTMRLFNHNGNTMWVNTDLRYMIIDNRETMVIIATDITEMMLEHLEAETRADIDAMTGVFNREATMREIESYLCGTECSGFHALLMIDVDDFKTLNDTQGHRAGDKVLCELAKIIKRKFRSSDIIGRIGGDEFFVFMKKVGCSENIERLTADLQRQMGNMYGLDGRRLKVTVSIGISVCNNNEKTLADMYSEADSALYKAKGNGKNCFVFADESVPGRTDRFERKTENSLVNVFHEVEKDSVTGFYNRHAFYMRVQELINSDDNEYVLIRFDIDRFKAYNDMFGSIAGDRLLADIADFIRRVFDDNANVFGRVEADHFVGVMPRQSLSIRHWDSVLTEWLATYSDVFRLTCSMGVYLISDKSLDASLMCDRALLALKTVKEKYSEKIAWYDDSLRQKLLQEQNLVDNMEKALEERQFVLYFQPQVNYEAGSLIGAEALVRWLHPERGLIPPSEFIPIFEKNGFIAKLDYYVWDEACRFMRKWLDGQEKLLPVSVSVNISRYDLFDHNLDEKLMELVKKYDLPPSSLKLEITESAYMDNPDELLKFVKRMQSEGFTVEMDDFGSGYSSLNTLKDVPVDILKLDVHFLSGGEENSRGGNILASVIRMANWLKLPVIAEGVENKIQAEYLKSLSCFYMQGYYFGKPMPSEEFEKLLCECKVNNMNKFKDVDLNGIAAFWEPSTQSTLLFNSFVGGAAILELSNDNLEIIRANDRFYKEIGVPRDIYHTNHTNILERFEGKNNRNFREMLERAITTGDEAECELESSFVSYRGQRLWTKNRVRMLARNNNRYLFYLAIENISDRKIMEEQLRMNREELEIAIQSMDTRVYHYDVRNRILTVSDEYAELHGLPKEITNMPYGAKGIIEEDRAIFNDFFERISDGEKNGEVIVRIKSDMGYLYKERLSFVSVFNDRNQPVRAVISIQDIASFVGMPY